MTADKNGGGRAAAKKQAKKKYYTPPTALEKIRHKLADGTPTAELLHYMHKRDKLPKDVLAIAEAAEKIAQIRQLMKDTLDSGGIEAVEAATGKSLVGMGETYTMLVETGAEEFLVEARKALVLKTMKQPKEV